jgi:hypothetical protein
MPTQVRGEPGMGRDHVPRRSRAGKTGPAIQLCRMMRASCQIHYLSCYVVVRLSEVIIMLLLRPGTIEWLTIRGHLT